MTADLLALTPEIIQRYNRPGPRYTSYPTVPVWSEGYFSEDYAACLQKEGLNEQPISLYLHIPFCRQLCTFCGCNKYITNNQEIVERYLDALDQEIAVVAKLMGVRKKIAQVHFGGGTPTFLNHSQLLRVVEMIHSCFDVQEDGEWALEADPRVTTNKQQELLYELGFRRISFGVQDLDPAIQQAINRNQTVEQSWRTLETARNLGYKSINMDLIYGLPLQTRQSFRKTLEEAILSEFVRLSERGGVLGAMETMYQRNKIQEESLYYETLKHSGELPIMGVNTFLNPNPAETDAEIELARSTDEEKTMQIHDLENFHKFHSKERGSMMERLSEAALKNGNIFEVLMESVQVCSLGQITQQLYHIGGQYRRNM